MDYLVTLPVFHGPLDLLLYLVKKNEVDILDIPISTISRQFLDYLGILQTIDIEGAGEFIVMAATLMEMKSKLLLPHQEGEAEEEEPDPRRELVRQLLEYRKFKDAAVALETLAEQHQTRLPREGTDDANAGTVRPMPKVELWDLVSAFGRLMRETQALQSREIIVDETPQHVYQENLLARLRTEGDLAFEEVFTPPHHRLRLIGLFLAILELIKTGHLWLEQPERFGPIRLSLRETLPDVATESASPSG